ncbi:hypothetical protein AVEN_169136-1 [Araneus ventricosus]|uniref:Uncharacterized protein n=1 Tax=Araneus ventricosus TaxID=182803 RepID=A0A4Y2TCN2_ARAVE|nr:hypothetical protein AVEN_169136-1 [Araneus ventricosus]
MAVEDFVERRGSFLPEWDSQHTEMSHLGEGKSADAQWNSLHSPKLIVWCGFTATFILGPFFFVEITAHGPLNVLLRAVGTTMTCCGRLLCRNYSTGSALHRPFSCRMVRLHISIGS